MQKNKDSGKKVTTENLLLHKSPADVSILSLGMTGVSPHITIFIGEKRQITLSSQYPKLGLPTDQSWFTRGLKKQKAGQCPVSLLSSLASMPTAGSFVLHMSALMQNYLIQIFLTNIIFHLGKERGLTSGWSKKTPKPKSQQHTVWAQNVNGLTLYMLLSGSLFFFLVINRQWRNSVPSSMRTNFCQWRLQE